MKTRHQCCECYHPATWNGDCREDKFRFAADELDEKYGYDWEEVEQNSLPGHAEQFQIMETPEKPVNPLEIYENGIDFDDYIG